MTTILFTLLVSATIVTCPNSPADMTCIEHESNIFVLDEQMDRHPGDKVQVRFTFYQDGADLDVIALRVQE